MDDSECQPKDPVMNKNIFLELENVFVFPKKKGKKDLNSMK